MEGFCSDVDPTAEVTGTFLRSDPTNKDQSRDLVGLAGVPVLEPFRDEVLTGSGKSDRPEARLIFSCDASGHQVKERA